MPNPFLAENCMRSQPVTLKPDSTINEAIRLIMEHKITGLTVIDDDKRVLGVISELDCMRAVLGTVYNDGNASVGLVSDYMSTDVYDCAPEEDIIKVAQSMLEHRHRRRPVTKDGKLVGQLSCRNILWAIMEYTGPQKKSSSLKRTD